MHSLDSSRLAGVRILHSEKQAGQVAVGCMRQPFWAQCATYGSGTSSAISSRVQTPLRNGKMFRDLTCGIRSQDPLHLGPKENVGDSVC